MNSKLIAAVAALIACSGPAFAAETNPCAPVAGLVRQARGDFQSLKIKKFDSGTCNFRGKEFRCQWKFAGDAFATAEAQSAHVQECALAQPGVEAVGGKKGETGFALQDNLTLFVASPELDMGDWMVRLRIVETTPDE